MRAVGRRAEEKLQKKKSHRLPTSLAYLGHKKDLRRSKQGGDIFTVGFSHHPIVKRSMTTGSNGHGHRLLRN